jgi:hypothetical protein
VPFMQIVHDHLFLRLPVGAPEGVDFARQA